MLCACVGTSNILCVWLFHNTLPLSLTIVPTKAPVDISQELYYGPSPFLNLHECTSFPAPLFVHSFILSSY